LIFLFEFRVNCTYYFDFLNTENTIPANAKFDKEEIKAELNKMDAILGPENPTQISLASALQQQSTPAMTKRYAAIDELNNTHLQLYTRVRPIDSERFIRGMTDAELSRIYTGQIIAGPVIYREQVDVKPPAADIDPILNSRISTKAESAAATAAALDLPASAFPLQRLGYFGDLSNTRNYRTPVEGSALKHLRSATVNANALLSSVESQEVHRRYMHQHAKNRSASSNDTNVEVLSFDAPIQERQGYLDKMKSLRKKLSS